MSFLDPLTVIRFWLKWTESDLCCKRQFHTGHHCSFDHICCAAAGALVLNILYYDRLQPVHFDLT